jgi:hypothetical protein
VNAFNQAWRAFYGGNEPQGVYRRAQKVWAQAEEDGKPLRGFLEYVQGLDKTGRDFVSVLTSFLMNIQEEAEEPAATPSPPTPSLVAAKKATAPLPKPAPRTEPAAGFDEIYDKWPRNLERPESRQRAQEAWKWAVGKYGAALVSKLALKFAEQERVSNFPRHFGTFCNNVLDDLVAAQPTEAEIAEAMVNFALLPRAVMEGESLEDAIVGWKRVIKPEDRFDFRVACAGYQREKARQYHEFGDVMYMSWESFLSRWRTVNIRRLANDALGWAGYHFKLDNSPPKVFTESLRQTTEVDIPAINAYYGDPIQKFDFHKICADVNAWLETKAAERAAERKIG